MTSWFLTLVIGGLLMVALIFGLEAFGLITAMGQFAAGLFGMGLGCVVIAAAFWVALKNL